MKKMLKKIFILSAIFMALVLVVAAYRINTCDGDITCSNKLSQSVAGAESLLFGFKSLSSQEEVRRYLLSLGVKESSLTESSLGFVYYIDASEFCVAKDCGSLRAVFYEGKLGKVTLSLKSKSTSLIENLRSENQFDSKGFREAYFSEDPEGETKVWAIDNRLSGLIEKKEQY